MYITSYGIDNLKKKKNEHFLLFLSGFFRDHAIHLPLASQLSLLYQKYPEALPAQTAWTEFTLLVVNLLSGYRFSGSTAAAAASTAGGGAGGGVRTLDAFVEHSKEVSKLLPLIWGRSPATEGVQECLKAFYVIISTEGESVARVLRHLGG